ncbi:MAG TPA: MFS transporter, partial [Mobilitalea sp.]|nr:MFS transporter [Mobilitalea sp.]
LIIPFGPILGMVIVSVMGKAPLWSKFIAVAAFGIITSIICVILLIDSSHVDVKKEKSEIKLRDRLSNIYPSPRKYPNYTWGMLTKFFQSVCSAAITYNSVMLMKRFHYDAQQTASSATILSLTMMVFIAISAVSGGVISDKLRKQKPFVIGSAAVSGIALAFIAFAPSFTFVWIGMGLMGFGTGMYSAVDAALTARVLPNKENVAKDLGIINALGASTQSIVPFIGPGLISIGSWPVFYGVLALSGAISAGCVVPIPEMSPRAIEETAE